MSQRVCQIYRLGRFEYQAAWDLQNQFAAEIAEGYRPPTLLLLEHPHTYTFGRRGEAANLLWDEAELAQRGITVHWVDRGGDVTYHGPGQLVGYPLIPLGRPCSPSPPIPLPFGKGDHIPKADYIGYIRKLERIILAAVGEFGVSAKQVDKLTGVWVNDDRFSKDRRTPAQRRQMSIAKLAAIGVKVDAQGISRHGFALNINPNMAYWEGIIGCGLDYPEISLAQLLDPVPDLETVTETVIRAFGKLFNYEIVY